MQQDKVGGGAGEMQRQQGITTRFLECLLPCNYGRLGGLAIQGGGRKRGVASRVMLADVRASPVPKERRQQGTQHTLTCEQGGLASRGVLTSRGFWQAGGVLPSMGGLA